jgi:hypothetical protein
MILGKRLQLSRTCNRCPKDRRPGGCKFRIFDKVYAGKELLFWMLAERSRRHGFTSSGKVKSEVIIKKMLTDHLHPWY